MDSSTAAKHSGRSSLRYPSRLLAMGVMLVMCFTAGATTASAAYRYIQAPIVVQEQSNWCWAAVARSAIVYETNLNPSQCTVVKWAKNTSSCANVVGTLGNVYSAFGDAGMNPGTIASSPLSYAAIQQRINADSLVVVRWGWNNTGGSTGHMVLIRGYNTDGTVGGQTHVSIVNFMNPLNSTYQYQTYSWMVSGGGHTWTHSLYGMS